MHWSHRLGCLYARPMCQSPNGMDLPSRVAWCPISSLVARSIHAGGIWLTLNWCTVAWLSSRRSSSTWCSWLETSNMHQFQMSKSQSPPPNGSSTTWRALNSIQLLLPLPFWPWYPSSTHLCSNITWPAHSNSKTTVLEPNSCCTTLRCRSGPHSSRNSLFNIASPEYQTGCWLWSASSTSADWSWNDSQTN